VPEILETLADEHLTTDDLLVRLGQRFDLVDADPLALADRLDELAAVGLVERSCAI
jgi:DNA-binding HxlR family transcriptional regulator